MDTSPPKSSEEQAPPKRSRGRPRLYPVGDPRYAEKKRATRREWCAKNRERTRAYWHTWKEKNPEKKQEYQRNRRGTQAGQAAVMITASRHRAKKAGIEHTITVDDLEWPTHCPVLGVELNYAGGGVSGKAHSASLDRHDNDKGYVPGNVRVISYRANTLKNNGTPDELMAVARYAKYGAAPPELIDIW